MNLIEALQEKQRVSGVSEEAFAWQLGISPRMWDYLRSGGRRLGGKSLSLVLQHYPDLRKLVWDYIESLARIQEAK